MRYLFILIFLLTACATNDYTLLRNDVNDLKRGSIRQQRELTEMRGKVYGTSKKGDEGVESDVMSAIRESQKDLHSKLSNLTRDMQTLQGQLDEDRYSVESTLKESRTDRDILRSQLASLKKEIQELQFKISHIETALNMKTSKSVQTRPQRTTTVPQDDSRASIKPEGSRHIYEEAYQTFKSGQYEKARGEFEEFIRKYPKDTLTDNAFFWVAETYYKEKNYEEAIIAYETMIKKFPKSPKVPGSLLKQAFAFLELPDKKTGKVILEHLVERFPDSTEAALAKRKLKFLR